MVIIGINLQCNGILELTKFKLWQIRNATLRKMRRVEGEAAGFCERRYLSNLRREGHINA